MKHIIVTIMIFICAQSWAQVNYVKNPSLEQYSQCPNNADQIKYANFWSPIDTIGIFPSTPVCSPEYCNACDTTLYNVGIPQGWLYYHFPRTGKGMAEVQMFSDEYHAPDYKRDYLQGRFSKPLTAGKSYCVTFYVTLEQASVYAIQNVAAFIDYGAIDNTDSVGCASPQTLYTPQVISSSIINDTLNWIKVQGSFTSDGTEKFITIGNFSDKAHTNYIAVKDTVNIAMMGGGFTWYLVDDISLIASDAVAFAGLDKIIPIGSPDSVLIGDTLDTYLPTYWYMNGVKIDSNKAFLKVHPDTTTKYVVSLDVCGNITYDTVIVQRLDTSIHHHEGVIDVSSKMNSIHIYPNPVANNLTIINAENCEFVLLDIVGKIVYIATVLFKNQTLIIDNLANGVYVGQIVEPVTGQKKTIKVFKQ